jgi:hypothetical protein
VAGCDVGTSVGNVIAVGQDGKIDSNLIPSVAITDVFVVTNVGELTSQSTAEKGDVAVVTSESKSYILTSNDYSNGSCWLAISSTFDGVTGVNGVAVSNGSVTIDSSNINVASSSTIYDNGALNCALSDLNSRINTICGDYFTTQGASDYLACYITSVDACTALEGKAPSSHTHVIADISGLSECLASATTFFTGAGSYSATQNGSNPLMNEAVGSYSVALGYGAKALQDNEVAHGVEWFFGGNPGDAQSSRIVIKGTANTSDFAEVATLCIDSAAVLFFKADMVGKGSNSVAFRVEGATNGTSLLNNVSVTTFADANEAITVNAVHCGTYVSFQASGENSMNWVSSIQTVKIK